MTLLIQQHLRAGGTLEALTGRSIKARRHGLYPNLVLLKYGIEAPFMDPLVRECRGLVLDEADDWRVVSRAFDKFGNLGEGYVPEIDWSTARVQEKLDGSLCVLYFYDGNWHVATSGSADASGRVQRAGHHNEDAFGKRSFGAYFWETFWAAGGRLLKSASAIDLCFAFELMGPENRVIVPHEAPSLRLLGVRSKVSGEECPPEWYADVVGIPAVRSFPLRSVDEALATFKDMDPLRQEGYVVVDSAFRRVKLKHPGYVALHHLKDGMGPKAYVEIARTGEVADVAAVFPEFADALHETRVRFEALRTRVLADYFRLQHIPVQKDFALEAVKTPHATALFQMRKGASADDFLREVKVETLMGWMGVADKEVA